MQMDFSKIFEYVSSPLCIAEPGRPNDLLYANKAYCDLIGYSLEELIGINPGQLLQRNAIASKREYMRRLLDNYEQIDMLVRNTRKDGTEFWNDLHIHPVIERGVCLYWVASAKDSTAFVNNVNFGLEAIIGNLKDSFHQIRTGLTQV